MAKRISSMNTIVRIGYVSSLLYALLPQVIYLFRQNNPDIQVELIEYSTKDQIEALKLGKIDLGFGRLRISDPSIKRILLYKEKLKLAAHKNHHLTIISIKVFIYRKLSMKPIFSYPATQSPISQP